AIATETSSPAAVTTVVVRAAAAAFAELTAEPMPARSEAAAATNSGTATIYDIATPAPPPAHHCVGWARDQSDMANIVRGLRSAVWAFRQTSPPCREVRSRRCRTGPGLRVTVGPETPTVAVRRPQHHSPACRSFP